MGFLQHSRQTPTDTGGSQGEHEGECPSPTHGCDCAAHLDTGSGVAGRGSVMCGLQLGWVVTWQRWFQRLQGGVSLPVIAAASSSPRQEVREQQHLRTEGLGGSETRGKGLGEAGHQASRGEGLARRE